MTPPPAARPHPAACVRQRTREQADQTANHPWRRLLRPTEPDLRLRRASALHIGRNTYFPCCTSAPRATVRGGRRVLPRGRRLERRLRSVLHGGNHRLLPLPGSRWWPCAGQTRERRQQCTTLAALVGGRQAWARQRRSYCRHSDQCVNWACDDAQPRATRRRHRGLPQANDNDDARRGSMYGKDISHSGRSSFHSDGLPFRVGDADPIPTAVVIAAAVTLGAGFIRRHTAPGVYAFDRAAAGVTRGGAITLQPGSTR